MLIWSLELLPANIHAQLMVTADSMHLYTYKKQKLQNSVFNL
jgi:hypothetical protein